jgi:ABC-type cobalamin/Fe3+-siderophores transport system ATPase subunit
MSKLPPENEFIGIVGPCSAGKSILINKLQALGYDCRHIAQEHSYVPDMWLKIVNPRILIYLDVNYEVSMERRQLNLSTREFDEQVRRLAHARQYAHLYVDTNSLTEQEVYLRVLQSLAQFSIEP